MDRNKQNSPAESPPLTLAEKVELFQSGMEHEQGMRNTYMGSILTAETFLLGIYFTLFQLDVQEYIWVLGLAGLFFSISLGAGSEYRARNVDIWRMKIIEAIRNTELEEPFRAAKYGFSHVNNTRLGSLGHLLFGHWLERPVLTLINLAWVILFFYSPTPPFIRIVSVLALLGWVSFAFRIIEVQQS